MAEAILMSGGVGGVSSDDVTAKRWHVVQGFTALTSDSGDEPANGELANKGNGGASNGVICPEMFYYTLEGAYTARFDAGAYYNAGERGQWKPYVSVPVWMVKQAINYRPEKTLSDTVTCQERGTVKMVNTQDNGYAVNQAKFFALDPPRGKLVMGLGHGNAYYHRNDNNPHVEVDASELGDVTADKVMQGFTATSKNGIKFAGTMPDYSTGRMVFRGATFDGTIATGVAKKGFVLNGINRYYDLRDSLRRCEGVNDGGIKMLNTYYQNTRHRSAEDVGCVLSNSINLTPFRQIKVGFVVFNFKGDGTASQPARIELEVGVVPTSGVGGEVSQPFSDYPVRVLGGRSKFISHSMVSTSRNAGNLSDKTQKYLTLDVSDLQGQYFLYFLLGGIEHEYSEGWVHATVLINSIQVIN